MMESQISSAPWCKREDREELICPLFFHHDAKFRFEPQSSELQRHDWQAKEQVSLTGVVHLEFIQGELKYLY